MVKKSASSTGNRGLNYTTGNKGLQGVEFASMYAPRQNQILKLLNNEFLTISEIAKRLNISRTAVYKAIDKLKSKGLFNQNKLNSPQEIKGGYTGGGRYGGVPMFPMEKGGSVSDGNIIRLHALHIVFKLRGLRKPVFNRYVVDGHTIIFYSKVVDVYINRSFYGVSASDCLQKSNEYINRLLVKIENQTGADIYRDRNASLNVKWHFGKVNDSLARDLNFKKEKLQVKWKDGKVWLLVDNSAPDGVGLEELETVHKDSAPQDMDKVILPFFNSLKSHYEDFGEAFSPVVTSRLIGGLAKNAQLYNENIVSHVGAIKTLGFKVEELSNLVLTFGSGINELVVLLRELKKN